MKLIQPGALSGVVLLVLACGDETTGESTINPAGDFATLKEEPTPSAARCETDGYGCGSVYTTGNLVHGAFHFKDLFVACTASEKGYVVKLTNALTDPPTFQLQMTLYGVSEPGIYYECSGAKFNADKSGFAAESCDVAVVVHQASLAASEEKTCELFFDNDGTSIKGKVSCPQLDLVGKHLSIEKSKSEFTCQQEG